MLAGCTTGSSAINAENNIEGKAYNLNGIPVKNANDAGLQIISGKTVVIK